MIEWYQFEINGGAYAGGYIKDILVKGEGDISVFESQDNGQSYQLAYNGSAVNYPGATGSFRYHIESPVNFEVSYNAVPASGPQFVVCDRCQATVSSFGKKQIHYFQLLQDGIVTVNGTNVRLYNMGGDEQEISFTSGQVLSKGFYKAAITSDGNATISYGNNYADLSYNFYNQLGQVVAAIAPEGVNKLLTLGLNSFNTIDDVPFVNRNEYDLLGRLIVTTQTDAGRTEFVYRTDGKIRFSQNAEQRKSGKFSYKNYDRWGRVLELGEYLPGDISFSSAKADVVLQENIAIDGGLAGGSKSNKIILHYDNVNNEHGQSGYLQDEDFLGNKTSWTENENSKTWYNYDSQGRIAWIIKSINGLGIKTVDYTYDAAGNTVKIDYQKNDVLERFIHEYEYDEDNRLKVAYTSIDPLMGRKEQARYYYSLHGSLKRIELAENLQGIDYTYTPQGAIKTINHSDSSKDPGKDGVNNGFAPDAFGMTLEYFDGDYNRGTTGISSLALSGNKTYYNGIISGQSWKSLKPDAVVSAYGPVVNAPALVTYAYDDMYQFNSNKYNVSNDGNVTFTEVPNANREYGLSYDANGNIKTLSRTNISGVNTADFNYSYQNNTNKLASVSNYATYSYNDLGQMIQQEKNGNEKAYLDYNATGKVSTIYSDLDKTMPKVSFSYDESGNKIKKVDHIQNITTYYFTEAGGNVLAIYDNRGTSLQQKEVPLYASSRLGTYNRLGNNFQYELSDHLGNVRVVINENKTVSGAADVVHYADYYPFGGALSLSINDYRYGYQGQFAEVDKETGWNNFDLRMYDAAIGRWMSHDPAGQFHSPYVGMGNNPIISVDPDGGHSSFLEAVFAWVSRGFKGSIQSAPKGSVQEAKYGKWYVSGHTGNSRVRNGGNGTLDEMAVTQWIDRGNNYGIASNAWNSSVARVLFPDKIGINVSYSQIVGVGFGGSLNFDFITRGHDASFVPYVTGTVGGLAGPGASVELSAGTSSGYYAVLDMRSLAPGEAANSLLGTGYNGGIGLGGGGSLSATGSIAFSRGSPTWVTGGVSVGIGLGGDFSGGVNYTFPLFSSQFK